MKRSLYLILYIAAFALALTACSESEELATAPTPVKVSKITVSPYPAFTENLQTRSVGTFDAGKTAWKAGDEILLVVGYMAGYEINIQHITLRYDGTEWNADKTINWLTTDTGATALYAPDWTFSQTSAISFELKEGAEYGRSEYLEINIGELTDERNITIDFSQATRRYNRLRIAGEPSSTVDVKITDFYPFGAGNYEEHKYSLTTDEKGNAYLYGWWNANASLTITGTFDVNGTDKEITLFSRKNLPDTSNDYSGKNSYVADARLSYKNEGEGTTENPYKICLPQQLASLAEAVNSGAFANVDGGIHVALENDIDLSGYPDWMPIGNIDHPFMGVFDGQEHTISNNNSDNKLILFGIVQESSTINVQVGENIKLKATEP